MQNSSVCSHGVQNPEPCPSGYYCPLLTKYSTEFPCPNGTYNSFTNKETVADCLDCDAGKYCDVPGLSAPAGDCAPGYYCIGKATIANPTDGTTGDICPAGTYCVAGSSFYEDCPRGTYSPTPGLGAEENCTDCDPGQYCSGIAMTSTTGNCRKGYYCVGRAETKSPNSDNGTTGNVCPQGTYCPEGTGPAPLPCPPGEFNSISGQEACFTCTPGKYCVDGINPVDCPQGFFCPSGTGIVWQVCPAGTYGNNVGFSQVSECTQCDGGQYCGTTNLTAPSGPCDAGYYCNSGSDSSQPSNFTSGDAGPCPVGHYCESGTQVPTPCPIGTFGNETLLQAASDCTDCTPGYFCDATGLVEPTGICDEGFYCSGGSNSSSPPSVSATGGPCPIGKYCTNATSVPIDCPAGTYNDAEQQSSCTDCPAGFFCPSGSSTISECPPGVMLYFFLAEINHCL